MSDATRFLAPDALVDDRVVLSEGDRRVGAREFAAEVQRRARALGLAGAAPDRIWAWSGPPSIEGLLELHAILQTGATLAPLNPSLTPGEEEAAIARIPLSGVSRIGEHDIVRTPSPADPDRVRLRAVHGETADPLALIWTSGSTGAPRGILLSASAVQWHTRMVEDRLALSARDHWAATLSPAHVGGLVLVLRAAILGCAVECAPAFDPADLVASIEERGVTHASVVPTMLGRVLDTLGGRRLGGGARAVLVGGAHAPPDLLGRAAALGVPVAATWGLSEMTSQVATATPAETASDPTRVGRPLYGIDVRVSGAGELEVRGPSLAAARLSFTPDGIRTERLLEDGWFATGDLGTVDPDGCIRVTGRRGLRIISGGVNVDPAEVERVLRDLDDVEDGVVVGLPDPEWGERVAALVVTAPPAAAPGNRPDLVERMRPLLAPAKRPRLVVAVPSLPLNANGKVDRLRARVILDAHRREPLDG